MDGTSLLIGALSFGVLVLGATVVYLGRREVLRWWNTPGPGWDEYGPWMDSDRRHVRGANGERYRRPR